MSHRRRAFSLIELLVVIGIIALLLGLLLPTLSSVQAAARVVTCQSNMRLLGQALFMYAKDNDGWLIPVDNDPTAEGGVRGFGTLWPAKDRWPARVFKITPPAIETDNPADYTPKVLLCPSDIEPAMAHTYALNNTIAANHCKQGSHNFNGLSSADVILAAEKMSLANDYYLEPEQGDFDSSLDLYRHGLKRGANYLFFDGHADRHLPAEVHRAMNPWSN